VRGAWVALIATLIMLASSPGEAHRISTRGAPPREGVSIPSLTHGQMAVIRDNVPAIRALASARLGFDLTTWRLEDYLNLQAFACLWGIVPGSITDEDSPFNECAHAYLAAGRALLLQLAHEPGADHTSIDALISKIEVEMLADGASLNLCRYSDEPFNTNEIIWPHWGMAPFHPPTLATFGAALALLAAGRSASCKRQRLAAREALFDVRAMSAGLNQLVSYGVFCGCPFWRFIAFEAPKPELSLAPAR
jgi:hypothetical protein